MQMKFKLPNYDDLCSAYSASKSISRATESSLTRAQIGDLEDLYLNKKTPLKTPVALADRRKSSILS